MVASVCSAQHCSRISFVGGLCCPHHRERIRGTSASPRYVVLAKTRFWSKVGLTADASRCWEWQAGLTTAGYGKCGYQYRTWLAHRLAWYFMYGVDSPHWLLHKCDNPLCVNPNHLYEGDHADNMRDAVERGRIARGERCPRARLTEKTVKRIKRWLAGGEYPATIARRLGVPRPTIVSIQIGRNWKHVTI